MQFSPLVGDPLSDVRDDDFVGFPDSGRMAFRNSSKHRRGRPRGCDMGHSPRDNPRRNLWKTSIESDPLVDRRGAHRDDSRIACSLDDQVDRVESLSVAIREGIRHA